MLGKIKKGSPRLKEALGWVINFIDKLRALEGAGTGGGGHLVRAPAKVYLGA